MDDNAIASNARQPPHDPYSNFVVGAESCEEFADVDDHSGPEDDPLFVADRQSDDMAVQNSGRNRTEYPTLCWSLQKKTNKFEATLTEKFTADEGTTKLHLMEEGRSALRGDMSLQPL